MKIPNFIKSVIVGVPIGVTFLDTIGYVARVDGISMQPVLNPEKDSTDYVFLSRWSVRFHEVARGDIISLKSPKDSDQRIIKRIVGLEGDVVATLGYKKEIVRVPEGHCWVEGDHTGHSMDSNNFGPVSIGLVTAKATCIVWPPSRWQYIQSYIPKKRLPLNLNQFDFYGSVVRKGIALGDVDNDGNYELVVGNEAGAVIIFKALERWQTITNLGFVSCVIIGDILNRNKNCLVIVTADGWCYIYSAEQSDVVESYDSRDAQLEKISEVDGQMFSAEVASNNSPKSDSILEESKELEKIYLQRIHVQRIPPNTKDILLGDIDGDGLIEMVLGLTDRVVRSYRWSDNGVGDVAGCSKDDANTLGKLVALNKWECAQQIGSISLHHSVDGIPYLLVAQPGGTFMRIHHLSEEQTQAQETSSFADSNSLPSENLTGFSVDYQFLGITRMRNSNISTEILGDLKTIRNLNITMESDQSQKASTSKPPDGDKSHGTPYALATLDGTIMLVQDEVILWAIAVDHQLFALTKLDVTGNGADEIVVCSWDGHTYILDQFKNTVRFQLDESVQAFEVGYYTLIPGNNPVTCFVYITFRNKILVYFDIPLKHMVSKKFKPNLTKLADAVEEREDKQQFLDIMDKQSKKELVQYLLYGVKFDKLLD